jgi:endonuclease IV
MENLLNDLEELYLQCSVGGALHIVVEDDNVDDESIQFCLDTCHDHWSKTDVDLIKSIGKQLLELTEDERRFIINLFHNNRSYSHSKLEQ